MFTKPWHFIVTSYTCVIMLLFTVVSTTVNKLFTVSQVYKTNDIKLKTFQINDLLFTVYCVQFTQQQQQHWHFKVYIVYPVMFTITRAINTLTDLSWASGFHSVSAYLRSRNSQAMWERFTSSALPVRLGTGSFSGSVPPPTWPGIETSENLSKKSVKFCKPLLFHTLLSS